MKDPLSLVRFPRSYIPINRNTVFSLTNIYLVVNMPTESSNSSTAISSNADLLTSLNDKMSTLIEAINVNNRLLALSTQCALWEAIPTNKPSASSFPDARTQFLESKADSLLHNTQSTVHRELHPTVSLASSALPSGV